MTSRFVNLLYLLPYSSAVFCIALAVVALIRAERFVDRWAFAIGMAALAAESIFTSLGDRAGLPETMARWQQWRLLVEGVIPGAWLIFSRSFSRDAERKRFTPRLFLWGATMVVPLGLVALFWDQIFVSWQRAVPGNLWVFRIGWPVLVAHGLFIVISVAGLMNLESTFRASAGTMRWRVKYMLLGVGLIFVARIYTSSQALLFRSIDPALSAVNSAAVLLGCVLVTRAIFRAGHFDLQVYPSQSVLQGSLTAFLAGGYLLLVGVLAKVVTLLGGNATFVLRPFMILAALVLLALLLQSDRLRSKVRHFVSRHFNRPLYDYRTVWRKFTADTATRMEQPELCRALVRVVAEVFQALSVTIWLVDETKGLVTFGASTAQDEGKQRDREMHATSMVEVIRHLHTHPEPTEFETIQETWAATLRAWHPSEFPEGGSRVCIPIASRGEVRGFITLGDRVGGLSFSVQDFDMFKCIAEHASASLLNVHLSQRLLQAKELESFQKMAAFFVHDLKNAASTLNLMLKNLPVHFDDPAFREDALRGIAKTVSRINELTGRLNTLRHEIKFKLAEADLNAIVSTAVTTVQLGPKVAVSSELTPIPAVSVDREQIGKVMVNLLLNAGEAMLDGGQLRITSGRTDAWAVITVADTGCGMSPDFVARSLFHPFQTTKKNGLGIGMFQCKAIVEAHGGKITVASELGNGTVFQVFLPFPASNQ